MADETQTAQPQSSATLPLRHAHDTQRPEDDIGVVTWASILDLPRYSPDDPPDAGSGGGGTKGALSVAGA